MDLTNEDVADILALLDSLPYDELDLRTSRFRLTLRRAPGGGWTQARQVTSAPEVLDPSPTGAASETAPDSETRTLPTEALPDEQTATRAGVGGSKGDQAPLGNTAPLGSTDVISPLPGTFYRSPRPGAAPFVEVGSLVSEDTVVAIVETMKLMNSVPAGTRGRVAEILVANAEPVAQGAALMRIEPA